MKKYWWLVVIIVILVVFVCYQADQYAKVSKSFADSTVAQAEANRINAETISTVVNHLQVQNAQPVRHEYDIDNFTNVKMN